MSLDLQLSDVMLPEPERVKVDYRQDSLPLCAGLYEAFLVQDATGRDALLCYLHLLWTYRKQGTDRPWAVGEYLASGLNLSPKRVRLAKGLLHKMGLVEYERDRTTSGKLGKVYTKLNLVSNPGATGAVGAPVEKSPEKTTGAVSPLVVPVQQVLEERKGIKKESAGVPARQNTPQSRLIALFFELYKKQTGKEPPWTRGKDHALLFADLKRLGEEKLGGALRALFEAPPPRMSSFRYATVHVFLPDAEKRIADAERRLRLLKTCQVCGKSRETSGVDCPACGAPDAYRKEAVNA